MLAGLLFATHDADDRPERLTATLPFGGATLIEHQARQLIAAGASQIIVLVARLTPELMGALHRVGRRGVAVDPVRTAREVADKLHPLARLVLMADGLVTTDATVGALAGEGGDTLLVVPGSGAPTEFERVGGGMAWAGVARLAPARVAEVALLPRDYDPQSALLRVAEAAGARHLPLAEATLRDGHGIEHNAAMLDARGRRVVAASVATRPGWFDRLVLGPIARRAVPPLVARAVGERALAVAALGAGLAGVAALWAGWPRLGLLLMLGATLAAAIAGILGDLRGEEGLAAAGRIGTLALPGFAMLALAGEQHGVRGDAMALVLSLALIAFAALAERTGQVPARWWGSSPAYLVVVTLAALAGAPLAGLVIATVYAAATLAAAIEVMRQDA